MPSSALRQSLPTRCRSEVSQRGVNIPEQRSEWFISVLENTALQIMRRTILVPLQGGRRITLSDGQIGPQSRQPSIQDKDFTNQFFALV